MSEVAAHMGQWNACGACRKVFWICFKYMHLSYRQKKAYNVSEGCKVQVAYITLAPKETRYSFRGDNCQHVFFFPSAKGPTLRGKNAPRGANSFLLE